MDSFDDDFFSALDWISVERIGVFRAASFNDFNDENWMTISTMDFSELLLTANLVFQHLT